MQLIKFYVAFIKEEFLNKENNICNANNAM